MHGRRLALVVAAILLVACCVSAVLGYSILRNVSRDLVVTDRERAAAVGHEIAEYQLPPGYREIGAMNLGYQVVMIAAPDVSVMIALTQFPRALGSSREEMERQIQSSLDRQVGGEDIDWQPAGTHTVQIKGQPVDFAVQEGRNTTGQTMRREIGTFDGKGGTVMIMVLGLKSSWDSAGLEQFFASIR